ncbi:unnamed protein product [Protopolystoma xenopodis]|uniref:Uncharacterized protein n=1 Tax=Protopolystoma xenopodis TaxID=117903 RepID=A0A448XSK2_9PLAT|nr:unnamed protein product [Protopolystoma xenopodis]
MQASMTHQLEILHQTSEAALDRLKTEHADAIKNMLREQAEALETAQRDLALKHCHQTEVLTGQLEAMVSLIIKPPRQHVSFG